MNYPEGANLMASAPFNLDEPDTCTCEACGQEYYDLYGCDTCEDCRRAA